MTEIKNTTAAMREDPAEAMLLLAISRVAGGSNEAIAHQEREGQRQLVNSDRLPSEAKGDRAEWEALGFTFGDPDPSDDLFMPATLPSGWRREASDHDMWSYVVDAHGRQRVAVFYKAAFYDRKAFMRLESVDWYVMKHVEHGGQLVITDKWATREAALAALAETRDQVLKEAQEFRDYATDAGRTDKNRAWCAETATERQAVAARYEAAIASLAETTRA